MIVFMIVQDEPEPKPCSGRNRSLILKTRLRVMLPKEKMESVETGLYEGTSLFSRGLRALLKSVIIPLSAQENRASYREQFDRASRNVEITVEGLITFSARHPLKMALVLGVIRNWLVSYFGAQKACVAKKRFLVYTQYDAQIPFLPAADIMYTYMIAQIAAVANTISRYLTWSQMRSITDSFVALNNLGVAVFQRYPTVIPRFYNHDRISLKVIQSVDGPVNCCPSLHIAYSVLLDNIARIIFGQNEAETFSAIRYSTLRMFNSVLYTKQHALIDVAFGIFCAELIHRQRIGEDFNPLFNQFEFLQAHHPHIQYQEIVRIYTEGVAIYRTLKNFPETIGTYLKTNGFVQVGSSDELSSCYFDTRHRKLVTQPDHAG